MSGVDSLLGLDRAARAGTARRRRPRAAARRRHRLHVGGDGRALGAARVRLDELRPGLELGPSSWFEMPQSRIDAFAEATEDRQSIHVDPRLAARRPVRDDGRARLPDAVARCRRSCYELLPVDGRSVINYGLNRVRFPAPVPAGSRVRAPVPRRAASSRSTAACR